METSQRPRLVWQRAPEQSTPQKKCPHSLCPWKQCEIRLYALFWVENPVFLDVYEERNPERRQILMESIGITLHTNHITITQFCDGRSRAYKFEEDPSATYEDWMLSSRRISGRLLPYFKPTFEVVYQHRGCLQAGQSIPIVVQGEVLADSIYYRRCDGQYRNAYGQALKGGPDGRAKITVKAPREPDFVSGRPYHPYMRSEIVDWAQKEARKQDEPVEEPTMQTQPLEYDGATGVRGVGESASDQWTSDSMGLSGIKGFHRAEGDEGEEEEGREGEGEGEVENEREGWEGGEREREEDGEDWRGLERERLGEWAEKGKNRNTREISRVRL